LKTPPKPAPPETAETAEKISPEENAPAPTAVPAIVRLLVWGCAANKNIVLAHRPEDDPAAPPPCIVRVRDNANFIRGMEVPTQHIRDNYYECTANPPRAKGRW